MLDTTTELLEHLAWATPVLSLFLLATIVSLVKMKRYPRPATLVLIGSIIAILHILGQAVVYRLLLPKMMAEDDWDFGFTLRLIGLAGSLLWVATLALWLIAAFVGRSDSPRQRPRYDDED